MFQLINLTLQSVPFAIAAHVLPSEDGPILLEVGPHSTFPVLEKGLQALGYKVADVRHVFLTHIHLDHAGAAWAFADHGATVYMHPFGRRHMVDPSKLYASAKMIYQDQMETLWGDLRPIPAEQIVTVEHGQTYSVGGRDIIAWHTPGHAVHHVSYQVEKALVAGDVAGIRIGETGMVAPPCPPPDIHVEDWMASIDLVEKLDLDTLYLSHYGPVTNIHQHLADLRAILWDWAAWMYQHYQKGTPPQEVIPLFADYVNQQLERNGVDRATRTVYESSNPSFMSVHGLYRYWRKKLEALA